MEITHGNQHGNQHGNHLQQLWCRDSKTGFENRQGACHHGLDYDRIELFDDENSMEEDRFDTIGDVTAPTRNLAIGNPGNTVYPGKAESILFVVYTERECRENGTVTRLISARRATSFERGLYYGKY